MDDGAEVLGVTTIDTVTFWAGATVEFPTCDARITTVPIPFKVSALPLNEAGPLIKVSETGRPDDDVALSVIAAETNVRVDGNGKLMV